MITRDDLHEISDEFQRALHRNIFGGVIGDPDKTVAELTEREVGIARAVYTAALIEILPLLNEKIAWAINDLINSEPWYDEAYTSASAVSYFVGEGGYLAND